MNNESMVSGVQSCIEKDINYETYCLIWLDSLINSEESLDTQKKLRLVINYLRTFDQVDECEKYIRSISSDDRIVLFISDHFTQQLIPHIHLLRQVSSIYIDSKRKECHPQLVKQYNKIKGVFSQLNELMNQIQIDQSRRRLIHENDETLSILTINSNKNNPKESTTGLNVPFLQSQLLLVCLLKMETTDRDKTEFISQCRQIYQTNPEQLKIIDDFEKTYSPEYSLQWYTRNSFVYRVQFEVDAEPNQIGVKPFANISDLSAFKEEDEILMMVGSVFCLKNIYFLDQIWHIEMTLCSDHILQTTFDYMKKRYDSMNNRLLLFANVLIDLANFDGAERYLHRLLKELIDYPRDIPKCLHALGKVSCEKGNYQISLDYFHQALEESQPNDCRIAFIYNSIGEVYQNQNEINKALEAYEKALNIFRQNFPDNHKSIAWCLNNLGIIYEKQQNYSKACEYLLKALRIKRKILHDKHSCFGNTYNNLGNVYYYLHEYDQLTYQIFKETIPSQHPSMAKILRNIGIIYEVKNDLIQAKNYYEKTLNIREKILSSTHPDLIEIKNDIEWKRKTKSYWRSMMIWKKY